MRACVRACVSVRSYPFSYMEQIWDDMYLELRCPNPVNVNPSYHLELPALDRTASTCRFENLARFAQGTVAWHEKVKIDFFFTC